jgi:trehalose 6-phosphate phosphatase
MKSIRIPATTWCAVRPEPAELPASNICLFLDLDGTLVEFAPTPGDVRIEPSLIDVLARLSRTLGGALAVVSGRALSDIDRLLHPLRLPAAGLHGVERRDATGVLHLPTGGSSSLDGVRRSLGDLLAGHEALLLEDKGLSLAVHFRRAPELRDVVWTAMARASAGLAPAFRLLEGDMVLEIKPGDRNKASAVDDFMREPPFLGRLPVFIGDDVTDYDGFGAVRRHAGITVAVGPRVVAQWYLPDPGAARNWLARIAEQGPCHGE